jgi:hypothetical protein
MNPLKSISNFVSGVVSGIASEFKSAVKFVAHKIFHIKSKGSGEFHSNADKKPLTTRDPITLEAEKLASEIIAESEQESSTTGKPENEILLERMNDLLKEALEMPGEIDDEGSGGASVFATNKANSEKLKEIAINCQVIQKLGEEFTGENCYVEDIKASASELEYRTLAQLRKI